jgi:phosphoribosylformylglycinamidine synthase
MHNGLPRMKLKARWNPPYHAEPDAGQLASRDLAADWLAILRSLNVCSNETKARQYDHEVKGLSVVKPFVGVERDVTSDATVTMIEPLSSEGVVLSAGILPRYSDIDTYPMMAAVIDLAIRRSLAVGGDPDHMAGLDNFCWPDPVQSEKTPDGEYKLAQLVRANQALYDYTKAFGVPCISGKDSMKNDSTRGGRKISIPPTVLFSTIARIPDIRKAVTLDAKRAGDRVCVVGLTLPELGGSEYYSMLGYVGNRVPQVNPETALRLYRAIFLLTRRGLARSLHAPALGGLAVGFAKTAMAGRLGLDIDLDAIPTSSEPMTAIETLFSESCCRFLMTIKPGEEKVVESILEGIPFAFVGKVVADQAIHLHTGGKIVCVPMDKMLDAYKSPLHGV